MVYECKDELQHYGIPGMRWGHRKARLGGSNTAKNKQAKQTIDKTSRKEKVAQAITKGRKVVSGILVAGLMDDIFYGGAGKKAIKRGAEFVQTKIAGKMAVYEATRILKRNL